MRELGLLSRRMFHIDRGRVIVEEEWNIDESGCPLIRSPWTQMNNLHPGPIFVRQIEMTTEEFNHSKIPLFN